MVASAVLFCSCDAVVFGNKECIERFFCFLLNKKIFTFVTKKSGNEMK